MSLKPEQRVKLKGALPPNTIVNGLADMAAELVADPTRWRTAILVFDVVTTTTTHETDPDTGEKLDVNVPTIRVRAIEEATPDDKYDAERLLGRAREQRQARERLIALALFGADNLNPVDRARYGAAGLLKHGSGFFSTAGAQADEDPDGGDYVVDLDTGERVTSERYE